MIDKNCIRQVLGCLIQSPQLLSEVDKYNLTITDFSTKFEKTIFVAINGLYYQGASKISVPDIEMYLESNPTAKQLFVQKKGVEYLLDAVEMSQVENFSYYYKKLKKINLLRDLKEAGFGIKEFYIEDLLDPDSLEVNQNFEELEISDIVNALKSKLLKIESEYSQSAEVQVSSIAEDIDDFIDNMEETIDIGLPIQGEILNEVINGAYPGALTIRSAASGVGKTRNATADAAFMAFPCYFDWSTGKWVAKGNAQKVLYIVTEQSFKEIKKMVLAYLTGINEDRFKYGNFSDMERTVINQAKYLIKAYADNFVLVKMPNPTIELVKSTVRTQCILNNIHYVFYDYIFIGPALLNEFRGFNLRNDEVLLMFSTALKDLAQELNVAMFTSTQVNSKSDDSTDIRNEGSLAGSRAIINKADNGCIMARPSREELQTIQPITDKIGIVPNQVTDVFKVRGGRWTQVRIWTYMDLGTMRRQDLFITNSNFEQIADFEIHSRYGVVDWTDEEALRHREVIRKLNEREIV